MNEIWQSIIEFDGYYEVSNKGRVKSIDRIIFNKGTMSENKLKGKLLKPGIGHDGELYVILRMDGKVKCRNINRLVVETFLNVKEDQIVTRIIDDKENNNFDNFKITNFIEASDKGHKTKKSHKWSKRKNCIKTCLKCGIKLVYIGKERNIQTYHLHDNSVLNYAPKCI